MKLTFWGATRQVTGSMFQLTLEDGYTMLIDCGLDMRAEAEQLYVFPFEPHKIDLVVLTHAHVDHSGRLPMLFNEGYRGQVLCTAPTMELSSILLEDSTLLMAKKIKRQLNQGYRYAHREVELQAISRRQVEQAMSRFITIPFLKEFDVRDDLKVVFYPVGHILGAASVYIKVKENGVWKTILFSGDIGRKNYPLLQDPMDMPQADFLVCESTYGNRLHDATQNPEDIIYRVLKETCVDKPGRLIIPAFSVGRTQSVLYTLHKLHIQGRLPAIKIFTDSPLAAQSSEIYQKYLRLLNHEANENYRKHGYLFGFDQVHEVYNYKESKAISDYREPCIILSSSGMLTGGRMQLHIERNIQNPYCTIFMVGYSAEGTPGHELVSGKKSIKLGKRNLDVHARIEKTDIYSGHADKNDLLAYVMQQNPTKLKQMFLVHGEYTSMESFRDTLHEKGYQGIELPEKGAEFLL